MACGPDHSRPVSQKRLVAHVDSLLGLAAGLRFGPDEQIVSFCCESVDDAHDCLRIEPRKLDELRQIARPPYAATARIDVDQSAEDPGHAFGDRVPTTLQQPFVAR